jgi:hypothetical protein
VTAHRGLLSLLQYAPDPLRSEAVNVGVVLLDPESNRLGCRYGDDFDRAKKTFAWAGADTWWLRQTISGVKASLEQRHKADSVNDESSLREFGESLGGGIRLTPPRFVPIRDFDLSLEEAFERLVLIPGNHEIDEESSIPPIAKPLNDAFRLLGAALKRVGVNRSFKLPDLGYSVRSDYDYRNGTANLIRLLRVGTQRPASAIKRAVDLGGESVLVGNHLQVDGLKAKLIVVLTPLELSKKVHEVESEITQLASDYPNAEYVTSSAIPEFAGRVLAEAI